MKFPIDPIQWPDGKPSAANLAPTELRWQSEGGRWRVQLDPVMYGHRVHVDRRDDFSYNLNGDKFAWLSHEVVYCCGPNRMACILVPRIVLKVLEQFDENENLSVVRRAFPEQRVKPMDQDEPCWNALLKAAGFPMLDTFELIRSDRNTLPAPMPLERIAALYGWGDLSKWQVYTPGEPGKIWRDVDAQTAAEVVLAGTHQVRLV